MEDKDGKLPSTVQPQAHHIQQDVSHTRAPYRQGKEFKAVKVYTINDESCYLILQGIPNLQLESELKKLCQRFGRVDEFRPVPESQYPPRTPFTTVFAMKYGSLHEARYAKIKLDNRAFYGGLIHICYAPELESVSETREKLLNRLRYVRSFGRKRGMKRKRE